MMSSLYYNSSHSFVRHSWQGIFALDRQLLAAIIIMGILGHAVLYSASSQDTLLVVKQAIRFGLGLFILLSLAHIPIIWLQTWARSLFVVTVLLLITVALFGHTANGAQRWLDLGIVHIQPSELVKLSLPIMLCYVLTQSTTLFSWRYPIAIVLLSIPVSLVVIQPDLGTAFLITAIGLCAIFLSGITWWWISVSMITAIGMIPIAWSFLLDYQKQRLLTFFNSESDPLGSGYHIIQSKIAIGSGSLWGKGWLNGSQSHLDFIPERSTDFVFATFAEEFGFMGILVLLALYLFITWRCLLIATHASGAFHRLLAATLGLSFFIHIAINISMVSGLIPVVGVPLPLISYGGSSLIVMMASFGVLLAIGRYRPIMKTGHE